MALAMKWITCWPNTSSIPVEGHEVGANRRHSSIVHTCRKLTLAGGLVCFMGFGLETHWLFLALPDFRFASYVRVFEQLPPGATGQFRLNPGGPWIMTLVKK